LLIRGAHQAMVRTGGRLSRKESADATTLRCRAEVYV